MYPPKWLEYSVLIAFTIIEFWHFKKSQKKFPYLEIITAQTTFFLKRYFIKALVLVGFIDIALIVYNHRIYNIVPKGFWGFVGLFILVDFLYYWHHRLSHVVKLFWITHSVHHLPNSLTVLGSYQQSLTSAIFAPFLLLSLPLIYVGFPPRALFYALAMNLTYQALVHNEFVCKLGWLESIFNTPAQHRIHHSVILEHRNKNFGGILCLFDKIFGTYQLDDRPIERYGILNKVEVKHPLTPIKYEILQWYALIQDFLRAPGMKNKFSKLIEIEEYEIASDTARKNGN